MEHEPKTKVEFSRKFKFPHPGPIRILSILNMNKLIGSSGSEERIHPRGVIRNTIRVPGSRSAGNSIQSMGINNMRNRRQTLVTVTMNYTFHFRSTVTMISRKKVYKGPFPHHQCSHKSILDPSPITHLVPF